MNFSGKPVRLGEFGTGNRGPPHFGSDAKVDGGAEGVFSFFRKVHSVKWM